MVSHLKPSPLHHLMFPSTYESSRGCTSTTEGSSSNSTGISFSDTWDGGVTKAELFEKELTPSDVGKLNRLVVPKKHALRWFPAVPEGSSEEVLLEFMDKEGRLWVFRYCYWNSSQSYVFTKGWNKFVREKQLKAKDVVAFYRCEEMEGLKRRFCIIDVARRGGDTAKMVREFGEEEEKVVVELGLGLGFGVQVNEKPKTVVKLFGVCIGG